ncbi:A/G-specific adenine glycosylase [Propionibacterium australiense]|uniref:Adenine DNA glycosylase n=1 Tax=Propionibacterium australiense TaxID=119981 RepID=A0A8B3FMN3_9ACTN|nr:A/G-specific adenine glycosylase [Propionibacterium australiense]RLP10210.1 A/G-specific adenine glycosylase [Propionibacterium australiense]
MPTAKTPAAPGPAERARIIEAVTRWFATAARPLPWREPSVSPWAVMVSEFMAQQTPVARVIGPWHAWLRRWPEPAALAADPASEAVAAWGRLGYPRRALRLHGAATAIVARHGGQVPAEPDQLRALPGVGEYTAAAIASFAFGARAVVLDTNVRRVLARIDLGRQYPANATTAAERRLAAQWLPEDAATAARWAAASMELGALVCTASGPDCAHCPVAGHCRWLAAGRPAHEGPARRRQAYAGTDRQTRGRLLDQLRSNRAGVQTEVLLGCWEADRAQARRALDGLLADGLAHRRGELIVL